MISVDKNIARTTAKLLLEINAVHFNSIKPFTLTSGLKSPVYIDCRKLISYPKARSILINFCSEIIIKKINPPIQNLINTRISDFFVLGHEKILDFDNSMNSFVGCCSLGTGHSNSFIK